MTEGKKAIEFKCFVCGKKHNIPANQTSVVLSEITGEQEASANCTKCGSEMKVWL